jgi:HAE1 family hydrophobic/amphiphilic exporter-1
VVRVGDVGRVERRSERAFATRIDGEIAGATNARLLAEDTNGAIRDVQRDVRALDLEGVEVTYGGASEFIEQMFSDLMLAMVVAIVLVYFVLVVFFGSIAQPITILAPVLFSAIGSLLGLIVTGRALGLPAMIGQLLLIGIVVANSILLVDTAMRLRRRGIGREEALREAARLRVRPVLMTAVATIAALTPLALGISGEGGIISQSLGTVVIGGLVTATLLTLVIVPSVFSVFDRGRGYDIQADRLGRNGSGRADGDGATAAGPASSGTAPRGL